jgi:hypothetical protein
MTITTKPPGTVNPPADLTEKAASSPSAPVDLTEKAVGTVAAPVDLTEKAVGAVSAPVDLTEKAASSPSAPVDLTEKAVSTPAAPVSLTTVTASAFPRTLTPLVQMDFAAGCYAQCGNPRTFDELFTYSRNSSATFINRRIGCNGGYEYFLDTDYVGNVENLVTFSEAFDNAAYTKTRSTITANNSAGVGSQLMDRLQEDATASNTHLATSTATTVSSGATVTLSIDAKADERSWILLYEVESADGFYFDVKNGVIGSAVGGSEIAKIEPLGNNVFRCSITVTVPATTATLNCYIADDDASNSYSGDGVSGLFIDRAQLTESAKPLPYVKTISVAVTIAFTESTRQEFNPETGESLGALIEGAGTNLLTRSEEADHADWTKTNSTITANDSEAPDETTSMDLITGITSGGGIERGINQAITFTADSYTFSIYAKAGLGSHIGLKMFDGTTTIGSIFSLITGEITASISSAPDSFSSKHIGGGVWRLSITNTRLAAAGQCDAVLATDTSITSSLIEDLTVSSWGAQCELQSFPTSYIRTEGVTASRVTDDLSLPSDGNIPKATIGFPKTVSIDYDLISVSGDAQDIFRTDEVDHIIRVSASLLNVSYIHGSTSVNETGNSSLTPSKFIAATSQSGVSSIYRNGEFLTSGSITNSTGTLTKIQLGNNTGLAVPMFGHISKVSIYDVALTAQEISLL